MIFWSPSSDFSIAKKITAGDSAQRRSCLAHFSTVWGVSVNALPTGDCPLTHTQAVMFSVCEKMYWTCFKIYQQTGDSKLWSQILCTSKHLLSFSKYTHAGQPRAFMWPVCKRWPSGWMNLKPPVGAHCSVDTWRVSRLCFVHRIKHPHCARARLEEWNMGCISAPKGALADSFLQCTHCTTIHGSPGSLGS